MTPIYCIGGANVDHKLMARHTLIPGTSNMVSSHLSWGGVARNVAENLAQLTQNIHLQCVVGDDAHGTALLQHIQKINVNIDACLTLKNQKTSHYYSVSHQHGEMHIALADMEIYDRIPFAEFSSAWHSWQENSIVFLDTNLPAIFIEEIIALVKQKNMRLCIDPVSVTKSARLPNNLNGIYLLKPNQAEAAALTNMIINSIDDAIAAGIVLHQRGVKHVVISLAAQGHVIVNDEIQQHYKVATPEHIQDVNGAGDAFVAGILYGLQQNMSLAEACEKGAEAAALTLQSCESVAMM